MILNSFHLYADSFPIHDSEQEHIGYNKWKRDDKLRGNKREEEK